MVYQLVNDGKVSAKWKELEILSLILDSLVFQLVFFSYFFSLCLLNSCKDLLHVPHIKIMVFPHFEATKFTPPNFPRDSRLPQECWPATWWCRGCWRKRLAKAPWRWGSSACAARWDRGMVGMVSWYGLICLERSQLRNYPRWLGLPHYIYCVYIYIYMYIIANCVQLLPKPQCGIQKHDLVDLSLSSFNL